MTFCLCCAVRQGDDRCSGTGQEWIPWSPKMDCDYLWGGVKGELSCTAVSLA